MDKLNGLLTRKLYDIVRPDGTIDAQVIVRNDRETFLATKLFTLSISRSEAHYALWTARHHGYTVTRKQGY